MASNCNPFQRIRIDMLYDSFFCQNSNKIKRIVFIVWWIAVNIFCLKLCSFAATKLTNDWLHRLSGENKRLSYILNCSLCCFSDCLVQMVISGGIRQKTKKPSIFGHPSWLTNDVFTLPNMLAAHIYVMKTRLELDHKWWRRYSDFLNVSIDLCDQIVPC